MMRTHKHPAINAAGIAWFYAYLSFFPSGGSGILMDSHKPLHLKTFAMILIMIIAGPLGNVLLGKGMKTVGSASVTSLSDLMHVVGRVFSSEYVWLGVASLLTFFIANILVLSWADYSFVQPASSMAYGVVALLSVFLLGEEVSPLRWIGIAIICTGVFIVGRTHPRTTEHT
jgi:drug/metabolite transporter (DMT)-like permease